MHTLYCIHTKIQTAARVSTLTHIRACAQGKVFTESALADLCEDSMSLSREGGAAGLGAGKSMQTGGTNRGVSGGDAAAAARLVLNKGYTVNGSRLVKVKK
jgi:hypothetical protein